MYLQHFIYNQLTNPHTAVMQMSIVPISQRKKTETEK